MPVAAYPTPESRHRRCRHPGLRAALALAAVAALSTAHAEGSARVQASGNAVSIDDTVIDGPAVWGNPAAIDLATWNGREHHFAAASGEFQTLKAQAAAAGPGSPTDDGNQVRSASSFSWFTPVGPGTSGLNVGDPITVFLDLRVDGQLAAGWSPHFTRPGALELPSTYQLNTNAAAYLRYELYDLDAPGYEGGDPDLKFEYRGGAYMTSAQYGSDLDNYAYRETSFESNAMAYRHNSEVWAWAGNDSGHELLPGGIPSGQTVSVDTGVVRFTIDTFVGNWLQLDGQMEVSANGMIVDGLSWRAQADFGRTFDVELVSSVPGIEFSTLTAGVYGTPPVPEPPSVALMLAGLAVVARGLRQRASRRR
jgi:hypothetical protein